MSGDEMHVLDAIPCGYVELASDGTIQRANQEFLELAGRSADEVVGVLKLPGLLSAGGRIYFETHYRPTLQMQGSIREIAFELVRPDGSRMPILVSADQIGGAGAADAISRTIVFGAGDRRRYEQELLRARREAEAAEARAHELATTLQQTFIPPATHDIPGLDVAGAYRPAGSGSEVGGDFYDVFQIRTGEWVVAVGDVSGKGVEAAVVTSFVRHTVRALAVQRDAPSQILRALNTALLAHASDRFCTLVIMRLLKEDDHWLVSTSSGGHPLPILVTADGEIGEIGAPGSLIGVLSQPRLDDERRTLSVGDTVVMFTDGVTEARTGTEVFGMEGLLEVIGDGSGTPQELAGSLLDRVLTFQAGQAADDIAIVALAVTDELAARATPDVPAAHPVDVEAKERALRELARLAGLADDA